MSLVGPRLLSEIRRTIKYDGLWDSQIRPAGLRKYSSIFGTQVFGDPLDWT